MSGPVLRIENTLVSRALYVPALIEPQSLVAETDNKQNKFIKFILFQTVITAKKKIKQERDEKYQGESVEMLAISVAKAVL